MTDLLTTALRELESDAPDTEATRDAVYQGIQTRARHRRMATVGAAALTVAALAVGAWSIGGILTTQDTTPADSKPTLVPVVPAELSIALTVPRELTVKKRQLWVRGSDSFTRLIVLTNTGHVDDEDFTVGTGPEPPDATLPRPRVEDTTVQGRPASARTYADDERLELYWQLPNGNYAFVGSNSAARTQLVAGAVVQGKTSSRPPFTVGLLPRHYLLTGANWSSDPSGPTTDNLTYCPLGKRVEYANCFVIEKWHTSRPKGGPGPGASTRCARKGVETPPTFGAARQVGAATVRLSGDGCYALKQVGPGWISLMAPHGRRIAPDDFARMAASIEMRR